ncbi:signal transduction histidine kinase [Clostridium saccharoperbutylacetonicum]|uniref:histidine kinase n=2 Tax=Clostridium saccharoperbutylacetonicum TaxID=36745 RepID=M1MQG1_9CLOT|nr:HAMP domain-containing sensor histidine kinase [Clostridium saccharoperbutylacetonicum]AGF53862.1 sensor histidine kinase ResE [Clostridium saccharoperbutylacetonicum N1-4(HMT)]NRT59626.1 signal transduction histidine kinase [Clostridium saccharoperbutylacetonicum]NSB28818.1 signal transduction histidine kinase [Clostridium saccharoperbutylacetonicum]NSB42309.1 signal transduction histidine kinase [Clostridium saccharoperbutylacetonicum]
MGEVNIMNNCELEEDNLLKKRELLKLSKDELVNMVINLSESKKAQEDFILNISHDLRSPLNIILSILQCYKDECLDVNKVKQNKEHIDIIKRNAYKILKLINNLIDTTKLEKQHYNLKKENLDIINLIEWNISAIDKYAKQKDISLVFDTNVEECVMAIDPEAIDRIIMNLISNAIKFSPQGKSIYINAWKSIHQLTISIKDEGIGISKEEQKTIFNRFVQSSRNKNNENFGSGIGLDLVRYLTKAHNGTIELKSEENKGSEFIVKLPMELLKEDEFGKNKYLNVKNKVELFELEFSDIYL